MAKTRTELLSTPSSGSTRMVPDELQGITIDKIKTMLPKNTNVIVTEEIVRLVNAMGDDTGLEQELMEEDFMSYLHLMGGMRGVGIKDLVNAIKYCNLKRSHTNKEAWSIVFPEKYNKLVAENRQTDNHISMYNGTKLVGMIDKEMMIPVYLQYSSFFHAAVKKQFDIMNGTCLNHDGTKMTVSPMVAHLAAKELAVLTKQPEEQKLSITVSPGAAALSAQEEMNAQLKELITQQRARLTGGESIIDVQVMGINFEDVGINRG